MDVKSYSARLDWLTLSEPPEPDASREFRDFARHLLTRRQEIEGKREPAYQRGYSGEKVGGIALVERSTDKHHLLIGQGEDAALLSEEIIAYGIKGRCTRVDVAATFQLNEPNPGAPDSYRTAIRAHERQKGRKLRAAMGYFESTRQDTGFTLGSRTGAVCSRFYDFSAKHEIATNYDKWRFEVECKSVAAIQLWETYRVTGKRPAFCAGVIRDKLERVGIIEPCLYDAERVGIVGTKEVSTDEKRLRYLEKVVLPMILKLAENGFTGELKELFTKFEIVDSEQRFLYARPERRADQET